MLLLDGSTTNLPIPKNQFVTGLKINRDNTILFFTTLKDPVTYPNDLSETATIAT